MAPDSVPPSHEQPDALAPLAALAARSFASTEALVQALLELVSAQLGLRTALLTQITPEEGRNLVLAAHNRLGGCDVAAGAALPLDQTRCRTVVGAHPEGTRPLPRLIVADPRRDPAGDGHPVDAFTGIGSYIGVPVLLADGTLFGTLCALDPAPRTLTPPQAELLVVVARIVATQLERDREAEARRASEARFRTIFEGAPIGLTLLDLEGRLLETNPAFQRLLGYGGDALRGHNPNDYTHPEDVPAGRRLYRELVAGGRDRYQREKRYRRRDGRVVWGRVVVAAVRAAGAAHFAVSMVEDITERKRAEAERDEARHRLLAAREATQIEIARELHDGPVQELYGIALGLGPLVEALPDDAQRARLAAGLAAVERIAGEIHAVSRELRPPILVPFGLAAAIRAHARRVRERRPDLAIRLDLAPDATALPEPTGLALFRIAQEGLWNVVQHAAARTVRVRLVWGAEEIAVEVRDDGVGFEPARLGAMRERGHLGLAGATERAEALGGRLTVESAPGRGTVVRAVIPLPPG